MVRKIHFKKEIPLIECWAFYYIKCEGKYEIFPRGLGTDEVLVKYRLYKNEKRPSYIIKNVLAVASLFLNIGIYLLQLLALVIYPFYNYVIGAKNFFADSAWVDGVRYFTWVTFISMITFGIALLIIILF